MSKSMLRLSKLRDSQKRHSALHMQRCRSDLQVTEASAAALQAQQEVGQLCSVAQLQHAQQLLGQLHQTAAQLQHRLDDARLVLQARSRDAKQIETIVAQQRAAAAARRAKQESQAVEAWLRSRRKPEELP